MIRQECDQCGEPNRAGALFCASCNAYLAWDQTSTNIAVVDASAATPSPGPVEQTPTPTATATSDRFEQVRGAEQLRAVASATEVVLAPDGGSAGVDFEVHNLSDIVDAYVVDIPDAPAWLELDSSSVRLMPNTNGILRLSMRIRAGVMPAAQTIWLSAQVRSHATPGLLVAQPLTVSVSEVDRPVVLRVEPSIIRVKDQPGAEFVVVADNSANNHPVRLELRSHDAEEVMAVAFRSAILDVPAGRTASVQARVEAPQPEPGEETSRQLTVAAFDGKRITQAVVTFAQRTSIPLEEPPIAVRLNPSVIQATDSRVGQLRLEIDNVFGTQAVHVTLSAYDAEGAVHFSFTPPVADVPAGMTASVLIGLDAPLPEPGGEAVRQFTLVARYGTRTAEAGGTFRQRTSPPALNAVKLRVEPPIVRVHDSAQGRTRVVADNRLGTSPARMWLAGRDHEGTARITFSTPYLDVYPGQQASADVVIASRRPPGGTERARGFTISASDGQHEVSAEGTFAQTSSDRRPLWRTLFTLIGALLMTIGALLPWTGNPTRSGIDWSAGPIADLFRGREPTLDHRVARLACAGAVIVLLAVLAAWGRLGPKGRLTRLSALIGLLLIVGFLILVAVKTSSHGPAVGAVLIIAGCVSAYVGGQLAKR